MAYGYLGVLELLKRRGVSRSILSTWHTDVGINAKLGHEETRLSAILFLSLFKIKLAYVFNSHMWVVGRIVNLQRKLHYWA